MRLRTRLPIAVVPLVLAACGGTVMHLGETAGDDPGGGGAGSASHAVGGTTGTGTGGAFISGGSGGDVSPESCDPTSAVKVTPLALTGLQYDRTVRDLLGDVAPMPHTFAAETTDIGFRSVSSYQIQQALPLELPQVAAEVASRAMTHIDDLWTCHTDEPMCIVQFLQAFAERAYRRPLTGVERDAVQTAFLTQNVPARLAARNVLTSVLSDPRFYIFFSGQPGTAGLLDPYAMASRLSYFLTRTTPDAALLAAAAAGELVTVEQVHAHADRLIATPGAREMVRDFFSEWLELDRLDDPKDPVLFPKFASQRDDMRTETLSVGEEIAFGDQSWRAVLRYPFTYVNDNLAALYGIPGVTGPEFRSVEVDQLQRVGFLTQASFLSGHASPSASNPVRRGLFVARKLLCEAVPAPPPNVPALPPPGPDAGTTRQRYAVHTATPVCAACHRYLDPVGFGFEHFDAIGQFRVSDNGMPIDATGTLANTEKGDVAFDGASELVDQLATLSTVPDCIATQLFRFALQRVEEEGDACSLRQVQQKIRAGASFRDTFVTIATTDAFRYARW